MAIANPVAALDEMATRLAKLETPPRLKAAG
jgi:hypothetical protein